MRGPFVCWHEFIQPEKRGTTFKSINIVYGIVEGDFKTMKQYYGNENYTKPFYKEKGERRFENIFEWYVRPYLIVKHEMAQTHPTVKNFKCIMWYSTNLTNTQIWIWYTLHFVLRMLYLFLSAWVGLPNKNVFTLCIHI